MTHGHKKRHQRSLRRLFQRRSAAPGTPPGTIFVSPDARPPVLTLFAYDGERCIEARPKTVAEVNEFLGAQPLIWVNIDGLGDVRVLQELRALFGLHALALEDVVNTHQRPKVEQYGGVLFIVLRMMQRNDTLSSEQVSIFLGKNFVLTFQENLPGDSFEPVRQRLRSGGPLSSPGPDYLAYRLIDAVIDSYFPLLEQYGELLETLEQDVLAGPNSGTLLRVHAIRHDLLALRRSIWPAREAINSLVRDPNPLVQSETRLFLRDAYDHTVQLMDLLETYRELGSDLRDLYMSSANHRLSEIMKVLTIISTIFIPLTFIAGVYGMNFDYMPELRSRWAYPATLAAMAVIAVLLLFYFYRKRWIGGRRSANGDS
jgi:magnesium transporter